MQSSLLEKVIKGINLKKNICLYCYTPLLHIIKECATPIMLTLKKIFPYYFKNAIYD